MFHLLITVNNFENRFPEAFHTMSETDLFQFHLFPSLKQALECSQENFLSKIDGLFVATDLVDIDTIHKLPSLKVVSKMGSGMDNIDLDACKCHHIEIINSKGKNTNAVAEMTLCLILASLRHIMPLSQAAKNGCWTSRFPGSELSGKIVGLVGFGMIARRVASLLAPFSPRLYAYDPYLDQSEADRLGVISVSFERLLSVSDIISVHIPLLPENRELFCKSTFSKIKPGAYFINSSRGALVNEKDLYHALQDGTLSGAACDVFCEEPLSPGNPLFELPNFIGTPHLAGMTMESMLADSMEVANKLIYFFHKLACCAR